MLSQILQIPRGAVSVIGSGGKSTLLSVLAEELSSSGRVILTTTTHFLLNPQWPAVLEEDGVFRLFQPSEHTGTAIRSFSLMDEALLCGFMYSPVLTVAAPCSGSTAEPKLQRPETSFSLLNSCCDYLLIEADGSRRLPLKAHAPHEPVIDPVSARTVCVVGASGFDMPIRDVVHRPEVFCRLTGAHPDMPASPELTAEALNRENLADIVFINQLDQHPAGAERFAASCRIPCTGGSLQQRSFRIF